MIVSFKCKDTESLFHLNRTQRFGSIERIAIRKLNMLHAAIALIDLTIPPGNRLEALTKERKGQHSIRVNDQYRVCFVWLGADASEVEIVDYH